jgi:hypothetical protein
VGAGAGWQAASSIDKTTISETKTRVDFVFMVPFLWFVGEY